MENKDSLTPIRHKVMFRLPDGKAKGMGLLRDIDGILKLVMYVDDKKYISEEPFETYKEVII